MDMASYSIAATSTLAMVRTAAARGIPTADLLSREGLTLESLEDPDGRIPAPTALAIWNSLRDRAADPVLQLVAPTTLPFGAYRVIDYLVAASATIGDGIHRFAGFFGLIAPAITLDIAGDDRGQCLRLAAVDGATVPSVYVDYVFAALVGRIRMKIRPGLQVRQVEFRQPTPPAVAPYHDLFRAPVRFGAEADRLCLSDEEWHAPTADADEALARLMEEYARILARRIPPSESGLVPDVRKAIAVALPEGGSASDVARSLHVSVRTLQRMLAAQGTSFKEVSEAVRARLAEEYLADPTVATVEVAFLLGFSDQSSFHRAFRRWTGESPGRWRRCRGGTGRSSASCPW
jgi:AraC-like DNA-binding protein